MPLNKAGLQKSLEKHFKAPSKNFKIPASTMAEAYFKYAKTANSCAGAINPASLAGKQATLAKAIEAAYTVSKDPASCMGLVSTAFAAFWMLPPVAFIGPTPGVVTAAVPATLMASLLAVSAINAGLAAAGAGQNATKVASQWATALDTWTKTILAAHTPPSACAGPLT